MAQLFDDFIITAYFWELMKQQKFFVWFPDNDEVMFEKNYDEFCRIHGLSSPIERYIFKFIRDKHGNLGYTVHNSSWAPDLMIPNEIIAINHRTCTVKEIIDAEI